MPIEPMDETQQVCFGLYLELKAPRSIPKLAQLDAIKELNVTQRMLKRWSAKYRWAEQAVKTTHDVARRTSVTMVEDTVDRARKLITGLRDIQDRFIEKIAIDPCDPTLDDMQKARAIDPDFRDFQEAVKLERLILGDPTERREDVTVTRISLELGESELLEAARMIASKRYGLPTPQEIKNVTESAHEQQ